MADVLDDLDFFIPNIREIEVGKAWKVRSRSHPEVSHTIRLTNVLGMDALACNCPATVSNCWHCRAVQLYRETAEIYERMNARERTELNASPEYYEDPELDPDPTDDAGFAAFCADIYSDDDPIAFYNRRTARKGERAKAA